MFARQGAKLTIAARNEDDLKTAVGEIGGDTRYEVCDVSDWASVQAMVDRAAKAQGGLDVMCANAGAFPQTKMIDMDPAEWDQVMAVNLKSSFLCVKASIPHFEKAGKGRVVLTSSITGPGYRLSRLDTLRRVQIRPAWLSENRRDGAGALQHHNQRAVMPGNIYTEGLQDLGEDYLKKHGQFDPAETAGRCRGYWQCGCTFLRLG